MYGHPVGCPTPHDFRPATPSTRGALIWRFICIELQGLKGAVEGSIWKWRGLWHLWINRVGCFKRRVQGDSSLVETGQRDGASGRWVLEIGTWSKQGITFASDPALKGKEQKLPINIIGVKKKINYIK